MKKDNEVLLEVVDLKKYFPVGHAIFKKTDSFLHAVDGVNFQIKKGETLGLVGESGCGKTTTGRTIIRLYNPTGGQILYEGKDIANLSEKELKPYRKKIQMIFQDPYASLNTRMTVTDIIGEGIDTHKIFGNPNQSRNQNFGSNILMFFKKMGKALKLYTGETNEYTEDEVARKRQERIFDLLEKVGLKREHANRYPHEFSGGQRQRIGIARALAINPDLIICDEPISALDVSIQAQVVNMLEDLQNEFDLTFLFIAHDLSMVKHISDRIGVMYLGKMMEMTTSEKLYDRPLHPYTKALLSSIPIPDPNSKMRDTRIVLEGDVGSPINPKPGCRFASRCRYAKPECFTINPEFREVEDDHFVACHFVEEINK